jgi:uncharacterized coiled-coil protein SlyX
MHTAAEARMAKDRRIGELEDTLKRRDRRIEELREEIDEQRVLIEELRENAEDYVNTMERWKETFDMTLTDDGCWTWKPFWDKYADNLDDYNALVRRHNDLVGRYNRYVVHQPVGRPLEASEAQIAQVRKLRKAGRSLRWIEEETSLSFQTVRTIVGKAEGTDRTSKKWERITLDRQTAIRERRRKRDGDALPRRAQAVVETGRELIKRAGRGG